MMFAAGIIMAALLSWQAKELAEKMKKNPEFLKECRESFRIVSASYNDAEHLLEKIKKESVAKVWTEMDAQLLCIDHLYMQSMLKEAEALIKDMPIRAIRINAILETLAKTCKDQIALFEKIRNTSEGIDEMRKESSLLIAALSKDIRALEEGAQLLEERKRKDIAFIVGRFNELKKFSEENGQADRIAICTQLRELPGMIKKISDIQTQTTEKGMANVIPIKKTS